VGDLELKGAGNEFSTIPEAPRGFHGHDVNGAGDEADYPSYDIVHPVEIHMFWHFLSFANVQEKRERAKSKGQRAKGKE
jgi:hypothetical protein